MKPYSIAIRTLGNSPVLKSELESIFIQTIPPAKVILYIAEGYERPDFQVKDEEYVTVKKGMIAQRLLQYKEINTDYILMLDDDVVLKPDSVEKLLKAMEVHKADLIGADTFQNHRLSFKTKIRAAVSNLVFPHFSQKWAFKIHKNGSFSYINNPHEDYYCSQSCAGNVMLWRKESYKRLSLRDELWLDNLPFAYGDDMLESYKVFINGMKLGVVFNSGIVHLDSKSASHFYHKSSDKITTRTIALLAVWWRTCFKPYGNDRKGKFLPVFAFTLKLSWLLKLMAVASVLKLNIKYLSGYLKGLKEGWKFVHSESFTSLPPYVLK